MTSIMKYDEFLNKIIETGIEGAERDYAGVSASKTVVTSRKLSGWQAVWRPCN
jgi:hypothetical protein